MDTWDYLKLEDLSGDCKRIADIVGLETTKQLMQTLPLEGFYIPQPKNIINTPIAFSIGSEKAIAIARVYQGTKLVLHKNKALKSARNRRIVATAKKELLEATSKTKYYAKVAAEEGLSVIRVRQIISSYI